MNRTRPLLTALILAGCATAPSFQDGHAQVEVDSHLLLADIALDRQDRNTAMRELLAAAMLSEEPGPAERATRIAHELELTEQGLTAGARWRELDPGDERPAWYLGVFETRANRVPRAITEFTRFMRSIEDRRTGFALVLEALGDEPYTGTATAIMRSLNETFPNVPAGQYALARLALRSGDFELALENAEAASQSNPDWIEAQLLYARTLLVTGRTEDSLAIGADLAGRHDDLECAAPAAELLLSAAAREAETRLNEILDDNPGLPEATRALAFLAMTEQRVEDAKRYFNDLRGEPNYRSEAFYYLGRLAETERDFLQATRSYARVTEGTHAVEAQLRTARILYAEQNDRESAVRHLRDFGTANPRFATDMLVAQAQLLLQMEQPAEAMRVLDEALASTPDDPALHVAHAQLYVIQAQSTRAATPRRDSMRQLASAALLYSDRPQPTLDARVAEDPPTRGDSPDHL
jgi:tetratricopeptide (TPR) repeat protein